MGVAINQLDPAIDTNEYLPLAIVIAIKKEFFF
jgi:hypothetical protein